MLFLTQNFNPINLDRKLDLEKECAMVKFLWTNVFHMSLCGNCIRQKISN